MDTLEAYKLQLALKPIGDSFIERRLRRQLVMISSEGRRSTKHIFNSFRFRRDIEYERRREV